MAEHPHAELVRRGFDAFGRGDLETLGGLMSGDVTHHVPGDGPLSGDYKGRDAVLGLYRRMFEETDGTMRSELQQVFVDGRGHAVAVHRFAAERRGRTIDATGAIVFRIVGDRITDLDECSEDIVRDSAFWA